MSKKPYIIIEKRKTEKGKVIERSLEVSANLTKSETDELFNLIYDFFDKRRKKNKI